MIESISDLTDDEVCTLVRSLSAIVVDDGNMEENDTLDETRIATLLGRTVKIADIKVFHDHLMKRYVEKLLKDAHG